MIKTKRRIVILLQAQPGPGLLIPRSNFHVLKLSAMTPNFSSPMT